MKKKKVTKRTPSQREKTEIRSVNKTRALKSVLKSKVRKSKDQFPGYPHYSPDKDIMNPKNNIVREVLAEESGTLENPISHRPMTESIQELMERPVISFENEDTEIAFETESEVTKEEKQLLESDELSEDMGEDEELRNRVWAVDMAGEDLDVPGVEWNDENENTGAEDEENNFYSIGGDRHEGLEEAHDRGK